MYSSKLSVSIHILCVIALGPLPVTSDYIAGSIGTNPALVRRLMAKLKGAGLIYTQTKLGATGLAKPPEEISLFQVFQATEPQQNLFDIHSGTNADCPIGANIGVVLNRLYHQVQTKMEDALKQQTIADILKQISGEE